MFKTSVCTVCSWGDLRDRCLDLDLCCGANANWTYSSKALIVTLSLNSQPD